MLNENRMDGWLNALAGMGVLGKDKTVQNTYSDIKFLAEEELANIYDGDGLGSKIINAPVEDMIRPGWEFLNDVDSKMENEFKRLKIKEHLTTAMKYARVFGGSVLVFFTERGDVEKQYSDINKSKIKLIRVYSAARINLYESKFITDDNSIYFDEPEFFHILKNDGGTLKVHRSRCLVFHGEKCTDYLQRDLYYRYWGLSTIQKIYDRLSNFSMVEIGVANLMMMLNVGKYKLANLAQLLAQNDSKSIKKIHNRIRIIQASISTINGVLLGEGEDYTRDSVNLGGAAEIIDKMMMLLSAVAEIPITRLFGKSPDGMNATGKSDLTNYYDEIDEKRVNILLPALDKFVFLISNYLSLNNIQVEFNSLWQPTQKEEAEINKINSETDINNVGVGIYDAEEARNMRYSHLNENMENSEVEGI